jgi:hypothetical protein
MDEQRAAAATALHLDALRRTSRAAAQAQYEAGPGMKRPAALLALPEHSLERRKARKKESAYISRFRAQSYSRLLGGELSSARKEMHALMAKRDRLVAERERLKLCVRHAEALTSANRVDRREGGCGTVEHSTGARLASGVVEGRAAEEDDDGDEPMNWSDSFEEGEAEVGAGGVRRADVARLGVGNWCPPSDDGSDVSTLTEDASLAIPGFEHGNDAELDLRADLLAAARYLSSFDTNLAAMFAAALQGPQVDGAMVDLIRGGPPRVLRGGEEVDAGEQVADAGEEGADAVPLQVKLSGWNYTDDVWAHQAGDDMFHVYPSTRPA